MMHLKRRVSADNGLRSGGRRHAAWRCLCALCFLGLWLANGADAQVGVDLKLDRGKYLRFEAINVELTLVNYTGNPLDFGAGAGANGRVTMLVETKEGMRLTPTANQANLADGLFLGAGETKTLRLLLNDLFNLQKEAVYTAQAVVSHTRLDRDYKTEPVGIQVSAGLSVWSREFGVPSAEVRQGIARRRASLLLTTERKHDLYALQVEDDALVYGIVRLGPRISGSTPQCDVDAFSNIHLLFMLKPRLVDYRVYDYNLKLKQSRYLIVDQSIPSLQRDPDVGRVRVGGGRSAVEGTDYTREDLDRALTGGADNPAKPGEPGDIAPEVGAAPAAVAPAAAPPAKPRPE